MSADRRADLSGGFHFDVASHTLPNGLRVLLMERPRLPVLSLTALIGVGVGSEGPGEAGLANFTSGLLPRGTTRRDAVRLAEDVDSLGASLGIYGDYDYTIVGLSCLSKHQTEAVRTLAEVLVSPAFLPEEVERRRNDLLSLLERRKDDPVDRVRNRFIERIYGEHPYRHPLEGYPEVIARLEAGDLLDFYRRLYRPNSTLLAAVGDLKSPEMLHLLEDHLGGWEAADVSQVEPPPMPQPKGLTLERLHKDGMSQATLRVGHLALRRDSPDYVPGVLMNFILGGSGFGSRLMQSLREEQGLTYEVSSNLHPRRQQGYFFADCRTQITSMNHVLTGMIGEIRRMRDDGVRDEELDWARKFFSGSLPLALQTNDQLATRVLEQEFYGLEPEFWLRDIERMQEITRAEVHQAARRLLMPERLTVVGLADFDAGGVTLEVSGT